MKFTPYSALAFLAFCFLFTFPAFSQDPIATDSLTVDWEQLDGPSCYVFKYAQVGSKMFAGTDGGLYTSTDGGKNWRMNQGLGNKRLLNFYAGDHALFAVVNEEKTSKGFNVLYFTDEWGIFRSLDGGNSWVKTFDLDIPGYSNYHINTHQKPDITVINDSIVTVTLYEGETLTGSRTLYSANLGTSWQDIDDMRYVTTIGDTVAGVQYVNNNGWDGFILNKTNIQAVEMGTLPISVNDIIRGAYQNGNFYLFLKNRTVHQTNNLGASWTTQLLPLPDSIREVDWHNGYFYFRTKAGVWRSNLELPWSFSQVYAGEGGNTAQPFTFSATNSGYWVNSDLYASLFSQDGGATWETRSTGLVSKILSVYSLCGKLGGYAYRPFMEIPAKSVPYASNQQDGEWAFTTQPHIRILGEANGAVYAYLPFKRTRDCGATWDTIGYPDINIQAAPEGLVQSGNRIYLWNKFGVPFQFSDDDGHTWLEMPGPVAFADCKSFIASGDTLLFHTESSGENSIYWSYDAGQSWHALPIDPHIRKIYPGENGKLVGVDALYLPASIYVSSDKGVTWSQTFSTSAVYPYLKNQYLPRIRFPFVADGMMLLHAANGLYISHNEGIQWTRLRVPFYSFGFDLEGVDAANGSFIEGADAYFIDEGYLYAVSESQGIWRTPYAPIRDHVKVQSSEYGFLKGRLYRDADGDCQYNPAAGDKPLGHKPVLVNPGNTLATTDANGLFNLARPVGNYTVTATPPTYYTTACTNDTISAAIILGTTVTADLPYLAIPGFRDLCVLITTPVAARPGFDVSYKVQVSNVGTSSVAGAVLSFLFNNQWLTPLSVLPSGQFAGNLAIMPLPEIAPGESKVFTLTFNVLPTTPLGTELAFTADCPVPEDANPDNNNARATQVVRGSLDPNDKNALPIAVQPPGQPRLLDYLIRFQNTGTDTAFTVVVTDTLEAGLNLMTLQTMEASHNFEFSFLPGRVCEWRFRHILLPDSNTNEAASHGYLRFRIETNAGLVPGTPIRNDADIFFDFNSPVRTNEASSDNPKWVVTEVSDVVLCAGDTWNGNTWTSSQTLADTVGNIWSDTVSLVNIHVLPTWNLHFDTIVPTGAVLFNILVLHDTTFTLSYLTAEGCDSTIVWNVTVQTSEIRDVAGTPARFELRPNPALQDTWIVVHDTRLEAGQRVGIRLLNAAGMMLRTWNDVQTTAGAPYQLSMGDLPSGMYFVVLQSEKFSGIKRLVKL